MATPARASDLPLRYGGRAVADGHVHGQTPEHRTRRGAPAEIELDSAREGRRVAARPEVRWTLAPLTRDGPCRGLESMNVAPALAASDPV